MAIDVLQNKIKKCSCVLMLDLSFAKSSIPPALLDSFCNPTEAFFQYSKLLLDSCKGKVPAMKCKLLPFALRGGQGLDCLSQILSYAHSLGYYTLLDLGSISSAEDAFDAAELIWNSESQFPCDAIQISGFYGSDVIKPFLSAVETKKTDLFITSRSATKSSAEIQDLLAGSRTVHLAIADNVNRYSASTVGKYKLSRVGITVAASSADSVRMLRSKYPQLFILIDGLEYPGANAKNCSYGFNNLGYGAIVCIGSSVTQAWKSIDDGDTEYLAAAVDAVQRTQKKLDRYVTVL